MTQDERTQSWWHTMPGMLTGGAAIITAITGLFLAFNQAGWLRRDAPSAESEAVQAALPAGESGKASEASPAAEASKAAMGAPRLSAAVSDVTVGGVQLTLLDVQTQPRNPESYGLRINVRFHNTGPYPANFWNANFRLLVDGVPRAPVGDLNKVVEGRSAQEGDVEFHVPTAAKALALQIKVGDETTEIGLQR